VLLLVYRPFSAAQPYAELGPILPCTDNCTRHPETGGVPGLYRNREMLIRGYGYDARIICGTGKVINMAVIAEEAGRLFELSELSSIHLRSPTNNCYHFGIEP